MGGQIPLLGRSKIRQIGLILSLLLVAVPTAKGQDPIPALVKQIKPVVVTIITYDGKGDSLSQGSGFFISSSHIISNRHVLQGAHRGEVKTADGKVYPIQGVVAEDKEGDLIQLSVAIPASAVKPLSVAKTLPEEGEKVVVVGSPLGLEQSISDGIVSSVRDIPAFGHIIQITAPISSGSGGSPVVNLKGEVIGVATFGMMLEGRNLYFALPGERVTALKAGKLQALSEWTSGTAKEGLAGADSLYSTGLLFLWAEDYEKALPYFEKAVEKNPRYADAHFEIGYCSHNLGRYQAAVEAYKQAIRIKPDYAEAHSNLGLAYHNLGRYQEAVEAFKQAIRIKPNLAEAHLNLGVVYTRLGRYEEAVEASKQAIHIRPDYAEAYNNLSAAYINLGRYEEAFQAYKQAIRIQPNYAEAHFGLGLAYGNLGRYQEAVEAYKQAIRIKPALAEAHSNLGKAYVNLGRDQEAVEAYKQAISIQPDYAEAHYFLGLTYLIFENRGSALEEYKILQTLDKELAKKLYDSIYK